MRNDEYKKYKDTFREALDAKRNENVLEIAENELRPQVGAFPKSFFRYRTICEYTDEEIKKGTVHLSNPCKFDDIFDSKCYIDEDGPGDTVVENYLKGKAIAEQIPALQPNVDNLDKYFSSVDEEIDKMLRIACFTQKNDNIPMWYYYADKHKGICIEYDISTLQPYPDLGFIFLPVIYPNKEESNNYYTGIFIKETFAISAVRNSLVKGNDWKFEKEWRIIKIEDESDVALPIKGIYFGCDIDAKNKAHIIDLVSALKHSIDLYEMRKEVTGLRAHKMQP